MSHLDKLAWAEAHYKSLDKAIDRYIYDRANYGIVPNVSADRLQHQFVVQVHKQPDIDIGLLIGDCLHNLRCALDHTVWHLVPVADRGNHTMFPIFLDKADFYMTIKKGGHKGEAARGSGLHNIKGVEDAVRTIIQTAQPFEPGNGGDHGPLWTLHDLERFDKHRVLHTMLTVLRETRQEFPNLLVGEQVIATFLMGPMKHDTPIATYTVPRAEAAVGMHVEFDFGIAAEHPFIADEWWDPTEILPGLTATVRNLIDSLAPFIHE